jgi:hypothetical protein
MCSRARLLVLLLGVAITPAGMSAQNRDTLRASVGDPLVVLDSAVVTDTRVMADTIVVLASDSNQALVGAVLHPVALRRPFALLDTTPQDTVRRRPRAVQYSDGYGTRLMIHRTLSWAMLPLFAASYVSGDQILKDGSDAPSWARKMHPVAATSTAVLFGANTVTGLWNLWEGRHDPNGRKKRFLHAALFMAASGGFTYAGSKLADEAEQSDAKRRQHRNVNLASMGVSTASWLIMLVGN